MIRFKSNQTVQILRESKNQLRRGNVKHSLALLESISLSSLSPGNKTDWIIIKKVSNLYNKLSQVSEQSVSMLLTAERLLIDWICTSHKNRVRVKERIIKKLLQTVNNLAAHYHSANNPKIALSCIQKHQKYFKELQLKNSKSLILMSSIMNKAATIYLESSNYKQAIIFAEASIGILNKEDTTCVNKNRVDNLNLLSKAYNNLSEAYEKLGKPQRAKEAFFNASKYTNRFPSAKAETRRESSGRQKSLNFAGKDFFNNPQVFDMDKEDRESINQLKIRRRKGTAKLNRSIFAEDKKTEENIQNQLVQRIPRKSLRFSMSSNVKSFMQQKFDSFRSTRAKIDYRDTPSNDVTNLQNKSFNGKHQSKVIRNRHSDPQKTRQHSMYSKLLNQNIVNYDKISNLG